MSAIDNLIAELSLEDPFTPAPPPEASLQWSEEAVREWFASGGASVPKNAGAPAAASTGLEPLSRDEVRTCD